MTERFSVNTNKGLTVIHENYKDIDLDTYEVCDLMNDMNYCGYDWYTQLKSLEKKYEHILEEYNYISKKYVKVCDEKEAIITYLQRKLDECFTDKIHDICKDDKDVEAGYQFALTQVKTGLKYRKLWK